MAKKFNALTNTQVKQAKAEDKIRKLFDGDGLALRIMPTGTKQWLLEYTKPITKKVSDVVISHRGQGRRRCLLSKR